MWWIRYSDNRSDTCDCRDIRNENVYIMNMVVSKMRNWTKWEMWKWQGKSVERVHDNILGAVCHLVDPEPDDEYRFDGSGAAIDAYAYIGSGFYGARIQLNFSRRQTKHAQNTYYVEISRFFFHFFRAQSVCRTFCETIVDIGIITNGYRDI